MEILSHVNKRVKNHPDIALPFLDLWRIYNENNASPMVRNFCIVYIQMSFERLDGEVSLSIYNVKAIDVLYWM